MIDQPPLTVSEDFAYYASAAPVMFFFVGSTPLDKDPATMPMNHSPLYAPDEGALDVGLRAMLLATLDFLGDGASPVARCCDSGLVRLCLSCGSNSQSTLL